MSSGSPRGRGRPPMAPAARAGCLTVRGLRHRDGHGGRQDRRFGGDGALGRGSGDRVAVFKPAVSGLDELTRRGRAPTTTALRRRGRVAPNRRADRSLSLRPAGLASPRGRAGRRAIDPDAALVAALVRRRSRRLAGLRRGRRLARASDAGLPGARLRPRSGHADGDRRLTRARDDQPHPAHDRGGARGRPRGWRLVVLTPWPSAPSAMEQSNLDTIALLGSVEVETLQRLDLSDPESWPTLEVGVGSPRAASSLRAA